MLKRLVTIFLFFAFSWQAYAQDSYKPMGFFMADSIKVGEEVRYSLSFRYPRNWQVLFPDSLSDYGTFEYNDHIYFPTRTVDSLSVDSAVYYLSTFDLKEIQQLQMAVRVKRGGLPFENRYTEEDGVILVPLVTQMPDSLDFKQNTRFGQVPTRVNYPYLLFGFVALLAIASVLFSIYGAGLRRWWRMRILTKQHATFMVKYRERLDQLSNSTDLIGTEKLLFFWKGHLERLYKIPLTKYTTKEFLSFLPDVVEAKDLKAIDRCIYAQAWSADVITHFRALEDAADKAFEDAIQAIKDEAHGK